MRFDRLTLFLMILCQLAQLAGARPFVMEGLTVLVMARMYVAYHPRELARVVERASHSLPS